MNHRESAVQRAAMTTNNARVLAAPLAVFAGLLAALSIAVAQPVRITQPLDTSRVTVLTGNWNPKAQPENDRGPIDAFQSIAGMSLQLKSSASQIADLAEFLQQQRVPSSPDYHRWLTPEQYATRFGVSPGDLEVMTSWLETEGFQVDYVARARNWILFSGTAGRVQHAFHAQIHRYEVQGKLYFANSAAPSIPSALAPVILLIRGLDDFRAEPRARSSPHIGNYTTLGGVHFLLPGDLATIYNLGPLYQSGITGSGQKVVVAGQSDIHLSDIEHFRTQYGLPVNDPKLVLVTGSADPGVSANDLIESSLDLEYAGGIAPNAAILFVYSPDVWTSIAFAIDQDLAPVISTSYGFCEPQISSTPATTAAFLQSLAQQGNSMGITWVASSGDAGAADCDLSSDQVATQGLAVDLPASVPEVTGVGGTGFIEGSGNYWGATNNSNGSSALSYIPETAWNDTLSIGTLLATGGGASIFFPKPAWQTGPGVPADNARDVPDVSFAAAVGHDPYQIYVNGAPLYVGGTSAPTPVFSGMLALLNQYLAANGGSSQSGLGNINPALYRLSQAGLGIFHDVTVGSNVVPCGSGSPNCANGQLGYDSGVGYDLASGLGSLNFYNLVLAWSGSQLLATTTSLAATVSNLSADGSTVLTATVEAAGSTVTPAGTVTFTVGSKILGVVALSGSGGAAAALLSIGGSQLASGANTITAAYGGTALLSGSSATLSIGIVGVTVAAGSVTPSSGSAASQTFTLQYSDNSGAANLQQVWVYFNGTLADPASNACMLYYDMTARQIYLLNDTATAWSGATPGTAAVLENSQCSLNVAAAQPTVSGNTLTWNLALAFQAGFGGNRNIYMYATDAPGSNSGWQVRGAWTVPDGAGPASVSVTPNSGFGTSQTFALEYSDSAGEANLQQVWGYFSATLGNPASQSCMLYYNAATNQINLLDDDGMAWQAAPLGSAATLQNNQCSINVATATVATGGNTLTLSLAMTFRAAFAGSKNLYLHAIDISGTASAWQQLGSWTVGSAAGAPATVSVTPNSGSGASQSFTLAYSDTAGAANLQQVWVYFNATLANPASGACLLYYNVATNQINLLNDSAATWQAATLGASATLRNSQCSVNAAATTILGAGNTLELNLAMTFQAAFAGTKNIYLYAGDLSGAVSAWQELGAWTVPEGGFQAQPEAF
jgi:hypothetical protein